MDKTDIRRFEVGALKITVFGLPDAPSEVAGHFQSEEEAGEIFALLPPGSASLVCVTGFDWNRDLSPWKAPGVFGEEFGGGADAQLKIIEDAVLPRVEEARRPKKRYIAGYSLAGLLAVYALFKTDRFDGAASVSGSLWFDGFTDFVEENRTAKPVKRLYLSLGDREKNTRNRRMAAVLDATSAVRDVFLARGCDTVFKLNPGGHFDEPVKRAADGIKWLIR